MPNAKNGLWLDYRADDRRMGSQPMPIGNGRLHEAWKISLGGGFQEVVPVQDGTGDLLLADAGCIRRVSRFGEPRWRSQPFGAHWITGVFDLDSDGEYEIVSSNGRELILLSATTGQILFRFVVGPPFSYGTYAPMFQVHDFFGNGMQIVVPCFSHKEVLLFDASHNARDTRLMHKLWMDDGYHPSTVIGDVNKDGVEEIVIARLGGVYVFDPASGRMLSETLWQSDEERRRNYGHFELADIDNDGDLEAVIISDKVTRHIAVLDNDGNGEFAPLWDRFIEHIYPNDTTELRHVTHSLSDINGDGELEMIVSIYNERRDERWYTEIIDPVSGVMLDEFADHYLWGVQDVDADGTPELCLSEETNRIPAADSRCIVFSPPRNSTLATFEQAHFASRTMRTGGRYSEFKPDVFSPHEVWSDATGIGTPVVVEHAGGTRLMSVTSSLEHTALSDTIATHFLIAHIDSEGIVLTCSNGDVLNVSIGVATPILTGGYHLTTEAHIAARPGITATVLQDANGNHLAVPDITQRIQTYDVVADRAERIVEFGGRSRVGYDGIFHSASALRVKDMILLAIVDDIGLPHSRLSLYTASGERRYSFDFPDMPPSVPGNRIGCYDWLSFQHSRGDALFISFYRSFSMNSECSLALLVESGEILWRLERIGEGDHGRGVGAWGTSALRYDADGTPVALFCAKDTLCEVDLERGTFLREPQLLTEFTADAMRALGVYKEQDLTTWSSVDDPFTAYGTPILVGEDVFIGGCFGGMGLLDSNRAAKWWRVASFGDVLYRLPAIGDIDGDGRLELVQSHAGASLSVYDLETGRHRESISVGAIATDGLTVRDSSGRTTALFGTNDGRLIRVGFEGGMFVIEEEIFLGAGVGSPVAGDLDGDSLAEIFVVSADGSLRCFHARETG